MIRTHWLYTQLIARTPVDAREADSIARFRTEWDRLDDAFAEDADPVHVTASAIVTGRRGVVLHLHKRLGIWLQPGGHIHAGEMPWDAARREVFEETGLDARHPEGTPRLVHFDA